MVDTGLSTRLVAFAAPPAAAPPAEDPLPAVPAFPPAEGDETGLRDPAGPGETLAAAAALAVDLNEASRAAEARAALRAGAGDVGRALDALQQAADAASARSRQSGLDAQFCPGEEGDTAAPAPAWLAAAAGHAAALCGAGVCRGRALRALAAAVVGC